MGFAKKIMENVIWRGLYLATLFFVNLLLARLLGASGSGHFNLLITNISFFILVAGFSLEASLTYFLAAGSISQGRLLFLGICWPLLLALLACLLSPWLFSFAGTEWAISRLGIWIAVFTGGSSLVSFFTGMFNASGDFKTPNRLLVLLNLVYLVWLLFFCLPAGKQEADFALAGYFLTGGCQGLLLFILYRMRHLGIRLELPSRQDFRQLIRYGSLVMLNNVVFFLVYRADYWLLDYFRPGEELGNYIQVAKIGQLFMVLPGLFAAVIFPLSAAGGPSALARQLPLMGRLISLAYVPALLLLALTGSFLFPFLYGPDFTGMYIPFVLLIPGIWALSLHALLTAYFAGQNKVKVNLQGSLAALLVILLFDLLLIPKLGSAGAAIGSSLGYFAYAAVVFGRFQQEEKISFRSFLFIRTGDLKLVKHELIRFFRK